MVGLVNPRTERILVIILVLLTIAAYYRVLGNGFVNFDDPDYIIENKHIRHGITAESLSWAFTTRLGSNWHPITWISHILDYRIFRLTAWGHHLTSLLLHLLNTILLFLVLSRMTRSPLKSAVVAGLFAVHPLHVESVAWGAERKDVLSTLFWMLTMLAYVWYVEFKVQGSKFRVGAYASVVVFYALGLMSKPMLVTLPFVLLLLDYWPLGRFGVGAKHLQETSWRSRGLSANALPLLVEKIPLLILAAGSSVVTYLVQQRSGAVSPLEYCPFGPRVANAVVAYVGYILKTVWPTNLAVYYPHSGCHLPIWQVVSSGAALALITLAVFLLARSRPYMGVGWLWYLGTLIPVIGLVQVGGQAMADRYTYVPLIGLFLVAVWWVPEEGNGGKGERENGGMGEWANRGPHSPIHPFTHSPFLLLILLALAIGTWVQVGYWRDSITLYRHAVAATRNNDVAHYNLGVAYVRLDREREAIRHFSAAVRINPDNADAQYNLGNSLVALDRFDEAEMPYREAVRLRPEDADAHNNFANLLMRQGKLNEAEREYREAIRLKPDDAHLRHNLVALLLKQGRTREATGQFSQALRSKPSDPYAAYNLANMLAEEGKYGEAIPHLRRAVRLKPDYAEAHYNLGVMLQHIGKPSEALEEYREAVRLKPRMAEPHNNMAIVLFMSQDYSAAWREVHAYRKLGGKPHPGFLNALSSKMPEPPK